MNAKKRLDRLEMNLVGKSITVTLKNGMTATIPSKRIQDIFHDVIDGKDTPETRIVLNAVSSDEDGDMIQLMQAIARSSFIEESKGKPGVIQ